MKAALSFELIGDGVKDQYRFYHRLYPGMGHFAAGIGKYPYWVKEVITTSEKNLLSGRKDYTNATRSGLRRVYINYILESGHIYEVKKQVSWKRSMICYIIVTDDGDIIEIQEDEVDKWIQKFKNK